MKRSKHQAVYKYLPGIWTSYEDKENDTLGGNSVSILLDKWNYRELREIFTERIVGEIGRQLVSFKGRNGDISKYNLEKLSEDLLFVEHAMIEGIDDVVGKVSPLVFYCSTCKTAFSYTDSKFLNRNTWVCKKCKNKSVKQLQMIYSCECGAAYPIKLPYKVIDGKQMQMEYNAIGERNAYKFYYKQKGKEITVEMNQICQCGNFLFPGNATDGKHYHPFNVKTVNLIDKRQGQFYKKGIDSYRIIVANWLRVVSDEQYEDILDDLKGFFKEENDIRESKEYKRKVKEYIDLDLGLDEETIISKVDKFFSQNSCNKNKGLQAELLKKLPSIPEEQIEIIASQVIEYNALKSGKRKISLRDSINRQKELGIIRSENEVEKLNSKYSIKDVVVTMDVELITSTFGYTRKLRKPEQLQGNKQLALKSYRNEKEEKNLVYCATLETEGILIDIDMVNVLKWLLKNNIAEEFIMPDIEDELSVKKWFVENIYSQRLNTFNGAEELGDMKITKAVVTLLHSISHALIKSAGILSGLDKNSLSEIIFPNLSAIFIYANTTQGIPLGVLSGMFEQNYKSFIAEALEGVKRCVFDPICMDRDNGACSACLHLSEISCTAFNNNLSRKVIIGHRSIDESLEGFWEV